MTKRTTRTEGYTQGQPTRTGLRGQNPRSNRGYSDALRGARRELRPPCEPSQNRVAPAKTVRERRAGRRLTSRE